MNHRFNLPFGFKLGLSISLLSVGIMVGSLYFFYSTAHKLLLNQVAEQLKNVGRTSTFLFDLPAKESIQRLKQLSEEQSIPITPDLLNMQPGKTKQSLSIEVADRLMQSADFQRLVQILRKIAEASRQTALPPQSTYKQPTLGEKPNPVTISTYLMVPVPQSPDHQLVKFIASGFYEPIGNWPGNPIGNLYRIPDPAFVTAFKGEAQTGQQFYTDRWGTWLTAVVPVQDTDGQTIALIGLDYDATDVAHRIKQLQFICLSLIAIGIGLSVLLSYVLARWFGYPIAQLQNAAQKVQNRDYRATVDCKRSDELGFLAHTFNSMVAEIRHYAASLQEKNQELETRVAERTIELRAANQEITRLNQQLQAENRRIGYELSVARHLQQMLLPKPHELSQIAGLDISGSMELAAEVGGDYYDVLHENGQVKIGIGDVDGHGLSAAVLSLMLQTAIHTLQQSHETDSIELLDRLNRTLYASLQRMGVRTTITLALLDYQNGAVKVSGQHEEILVVRADGAIERINTLNLGIPLGLNLNIAQFINQVEIQLNRGDGIVLYTDGITAAENNVCQRYGLDRLCQVISQSWKGSADTVKASILADVHCHIGNQKVADDITLLVIKQK
ncbi:MAG: SpoIIE family protein phosphatase [Scytolyngbya sp. HA4215-MV1]|nr:SpoIIE family protein phosphatase [Scytolyngbya sp. HA4215-MV1]